MAKKARSKAKQAKKQAKKTSVNSSHISLDVLHKYTISDLSPLLQNRAYGMIGSIRNLMATHNSLVDSVKKQAKKLA